MNRRELVYLEVCRLVERRRAAKQVPEAIGFFEVVKAVRRHYQNPPTYEQIQRSLNELVEAGRLHRAVDDYAVPAHRIGGSRRALR